MPLTAHLAAVAADVGHYSRLGRRLQPHLAAGTTQAELSELIAQVRAERARQDQVRAARRALRRAGHDPLADRPAGYALANWRYRQAVEARQQTEAEAAARHRAACAEVLAAAEPWLAMPCRWHAARAALALEIRCAEHRDLVSPESLRCRLARYAVEAAAHAALRDVPGTRLRHRSESGSIYLVRGDAHLRISDHELGWGDYGTREQVHRGPEVVLTGDETPAEVASLIAEALAGESVAV